MANHCVYCDRRWPPEPVRMIVLGEDWLECCIECFDNGEGEFTNFETGQKVNFKELWEILNKEKENVVQQED